jgi:folate-binding protein YgfZ
MTPLVFVAVREPWGLVVVNGPDATSFLQSLVSQDLDPIAIDETASSMLLSPQGKLDVLFRITRVADDEWWLDTEADFGSRLAASLTRFRIRVKAEIEDRTDTSALLSVVGAVAPAAEGARALPARWGDAAGVDLVGDATAVAAARDAVDDSVARWSAEQLEAFRIEQGVPRLGTDLDEKTIPQEAFLEADAVSFTKGCFLGQELVTRIDTRGHVNRYLRRLAVEGDVVPPRGASIEADGKEVGTVTSSAAVPDDGRIVALGMVRREVEPPAGVTLRWDGVDASAAVLLRAG